MKKVNQANEHQTARHKASQVLGKIDYDFRKFTMEDFVRQVEVSTGRSIHFIPYDMPLGVFGAWISDHEDPAEYIFYRKDVPELHQVHIQLHELAHFLCGHTTLTTGSHHLNNLLHGSPEPAFRQIKLRTHQSANAELEAEVLASTIQEQVIRASRLNYLTRVVSSDPKVSRYFQSLGIT